MHSCLSHISIRQLCNSPSFSFSFASYGWLSSEAKPLKKGGKKEHKRKKNDFNDLMRCSKQYNEKCNITFVKHVSPSARHPPPRAQTCRVLAQRDCL